MAELSPKDPRRQVVLVIEAGRLLRRSGVEKPVDPEQASDLTADASTETPNSSAIDQDPDPTTREIFRRSGYAGLRMRRVRPPEDIPGVETDIGMIPATPGSELPPPAA